MKCNIKNRAGAGIFIALFFLLTILPLKASGEVVDRVVAVVNDSIITLSELNAAYAVSGEALKDEPVVLGQGSFTSEKASEIIDTLIEQKLIKQGADKIGVEVSESDIDMAVDDVIKQNRVTKENFIVMLSNSGLTLKEYREQLRARIREIKFVNKQFRSKVFVEEADMEEFYTQNLDKFLAPPSIRLRLIFFSNQDKDLMAKRLEIVLKGLEEGREFAALASEYSEGPATSKGGDLGYLAVGEMDKKISATARKLKPGEVSEPIYTTQGVTLLQLVDSRAQVPRPFEEVKAGIKNALTNKFLEENFNYWIKEIKELAHIEVRL
ncbi:MAG: peptidylprolyl isomerase [Proteobacteria bacterium]|nr:peptidylprolyl isomerase [Pseudomonadota bacterium]